MVQDWRMGAEYRTKDGYTVEVVRLADTGEWLRVRYHGFHVADVRTISELERYVPLADLEEALTPRSGPPPVPRSSTSPSSRRGGHAPADCRTPAGRARSPGQPGPRTATGQPGARLVRVKA